MQIASDVVTGFCVFSCEVQIIVAYASTVNITQPNQSDKLTTDQTCFFGSKIFHTDYLSTSARHLPKHFWYSSFAFIVINFACLQVISEGFKIWQQGLGVSTTGHFPKEEKLGLKIVKISLTNF